MDVGQEERRRRAGRFRMLQYELALRVLGPGQHRERDRVQRVVRDEDQTPPGQLLTQRPQNQARHALCRGSYRARGCLAVAQAIAQLRRSVGNLRSLCQPHDSQSALAEDECEHVLRSDGVLDESGTELAQSLTEPLAIQGIRAAALLARGALERIDHLRRSRR